MRCHWRSEALALVVMAVAVSAAAQQTTGALEGWVRDVDGRSVTQASISLHERESGLVRHRLTDASGHFRFPSLPPGDYDLTASADGNRTGRWRGPVLVGRTTRAELRVTAEGADAATPAPRPAVDTFSAASSHTVEPQQLAVRVPVEREMTPAVLLEPGSIVGDAGFNSGFDGLWLYTPGQRYSSIGGGSIAENRYLIDGLDVTNLRDGLGSTMVPFELVDQLQLAQGGWSASLTGSTGGVVNLVSRRGGNQLHGGASLYWHPEELQENEPGALHRPNHDERRQSLEVNASLGGPILRDRLFFFAFVRFSDAEWLDLLNASGTERALSDPYAGGRLDWSPAARHRLGLTVLDDSVTVEASQRPYDPTSGELGAAVEVTEERRGGISWAAAYDGLLTDSLSLAARIGRNDFDRVDRSEADRYPYALDCRVACQPIGLWTSWHRIPTDEDSRDAYRLDVDWQLGRHGLRGGVDIADGETRVLEEYSGGVRYLYRFNGGRYPELPADTEIVEVRGRRSEGEVGVESEAVFLQDRWTPSDRLTLEAGLRWERHSSTNAAGGTLLEVNDAVLPRLGAVWDPTGAGRSRLFASYGWYQLPIPSRVPVRLGLAATDVTRVYPLDGAILADGSPEGLGPLLQESWLADGSVADPRGMIGSDLDAHKQWELIVGGEWTQDGLWTFGARAAVRETTEILEDFTIDEGLAARYGVEIPVFASYIGNPGCEFEGWYDLDNDGQLDRISLSAAELGYPEPERTFLSLELTAERRLTDRWTLRGSYTWSHSYGNYEGWAGSDDSRGDRAVLSPRWDSPGLMDHSSGDLPNDRRHVVKAAGVYAFPFGLDVGGFGWWSSGRPVNGFGVHPSDELAASYGPASFFVGGEPCPRGCAGTTGSTWGLDLMVRYGFRAAGVRWDLRVDAFNLLDNDGAVEVEEIAETGAGEPSPSYLEPLYFQTPRGVRIGIGVGF
jgi:hypothetical protein